MGMNRRRFFIILGVVAIIILAIALGAGLGVGLSNNDDDSSYVNFNSDNTLLLTLLQK
jgi:hypothetical protein